MVNVNTEELEDDDVTDDLVVEVDETDESVVEDDATDELVVEGDDANELVDESDTSASVEMVNINPEEVVEEDVESSGPVVGAAVAEDELDSSAIVDEEVAED